LKQEVKQEALPGGFHSLGATSCELRVVSTLWRTGQTYRWVRRGDPHPYREAADEVEADEEAWEVLGCELLGVVEDVVFGLVGEDDDTGFKVLYSGRGTLSPSHARCMLREYLQLDRIQRAPLDEAWAQEHSRYAATVAATPGVRCIRGAVLETVVCMMGSANNNIQRNTKMVQALCGAFPSNHLATFCGWELHSFPTLDQLLQLDEARWWELGWGYRAPRMVNAMGEVAEAGGQPWLDELAQRDPGDARTALLALPGVGPKVADLSLLFGLGMHGVVPLDTRTARLHLRKEMSSVNYEQLQALMAEQFGWAAGWAFFTLFVAELTGSMPAVDRRIKHEVKDEHTMVKTEEKVKVEPVKAEPGLNANMVGSEAKIEVKQEEKGNAHAGVKTRLQRKQGR